MVIGGAKLINRMLSIIPLNGAQIPGQASALSERHGAEMVATLNTIEAPVYVPLTRKA